MKNSISGFLLYLFIIVICKTGHSQIGDLTSSGGIIKQKDKEFSEWMDATDRALFGAFDDPGSDSFTAPKALPFDEIIWDTSITGNGTIIKEIRPIDNQLYPRKNNNLAKVEFSGYLAGSDNLYFRITKTDFYDKSTSEKYTADLDSERHFNFHYFIEAELSTWRFEYSLNNKDWIKIAQNVVCGDAYIIYGQSWAQGNSLTPSEESDINTTYGGLNPIYGNFIRTYGDIYTSPYRADNWKLAKAHKNNTSNVGVFGLVMQYNIARTNRIPTCFINGAVGGKSIQELLPPDQNYEFAQVNDLITDYKYFANLNSRVYMAGLENDIKGIFWWQTDIRPNVASKLGDYITAFEPMLLLWRTYYKDFKQTYLIQPKIGVTSAYCARVTSEDIRQMQFIYKNTSVMSANGIGDVLPQPESSHFGPVANIEMGKRLFRLLQRDFYDLPQSDIDPPDIISATLTGNTLTLTFNQPLSLKLSSPLKNILEVILFNSGYNIKTNPRIIGNKLLFEISNTNVWDVSFAGFIPDINNNGINDDYNFPCNLNNSKGVSAYSFLKTHIKVNEKLNIDDSGFVDSLFPTLNDINIYPNPVDDFLQIDLPDKNPVSVQLYNSMGLKIDEITTSEKFQTLNCYNLHAGTYFLVISMGDYRAIKPFIKI